MAHTAVGTTFHAIPPGDLNAENDRADGRASFLRAPDTVAPPVALEPDNSPLSVSKVPCHETISTRFKSFPGAGGPPQPWRGAELTATGLQVDRNPGV